MSIPPPPPPPSETISQTPGVSPSPEETPIATMAGVTLGQRQETARRNIAYGAIAAFLAFLLVPLVAWVAKAIALDDAVKMMTTIASVLAGIVGAVVGFYFHVQESSSG